jgi:diguanylate cyclase (GGDEF)-like protein
MDVSSTVGAGSPSMGMVVLDLQTFMLVIGIGNLCFAGLMAAYARGAAAQPALRMWMWARVALGLCQAASWLNLQWNSPAFAQLICLSWIGGMALELAAYCLFFGFSQWRRLLYPATVLAMLVVACAQLRGVSVTQLIAIISFVVALFAGCMGSLLLWPRGGTPVLQRIIGANDTMLALAVLLWVWSSLRHSGAQATGSALIQSFAFFAGYMLMIVRGFGFLLLCKQEDDRKMLHLATVDSLTGLLNRHAFFAQAQALRQRPAGAAQMALLMLDLDHFKRINDRFGHATGDDALRLFAQAVQGVLAGRGILGRLGGEEFALALAAPLEEAFHVAEQLRVAVTDARLAAGGDAVTLTVSIGVAALASGEALNAGLARADQALYDAKRAGRNCVQAESAAANRVRGDMGSPVPCARQQSFA